MSENLLVFTPDGEVQELSGFPSSMEYRDSYIYNKLSGFWYKGWARAGMQWMPINSCNVPEKYKLLKLLIS